MAEVGLEMLQGLIQRVLDEQAPQRREMNDLRTLTLLLADQGRRIERRLNELRDELELMLISKLMGRMGFFETRMEHRLEAIEARLPEAA